MDELPAIPGAESIPGKLFFRIGEVSQIVGVEPHVLRYWESEFPGLSPRKSSSGQRMFRRGDVELLLRIRQLLYDRKFTIEGARQALHEERGDRREDKREGRREDKRGESRTAPASRPVKRSGQGELFPARDPLPEIRRQLAEILKILS